MGGGGGRVDGRWYCNNTSTGQIWQNKNKICSKHRYIHYMLLIFFLFLNLKISIATKLIEFFFLVKLNIGPLMVLRLFFCSFYIPLNTESLDARGASVRHRVLNLYLKRKNDISHKLSYFLVKVNCRVALYFSEEKEVRQEE